MSGYEMLNTPGRPFGYPLGRTLSKPTNRQDSDLQASGENNLSSNSAVLQRQLGNSSGCGGSGTESKAFVSRAAATAAVPAVSPCSGSLLLEVDELLRGVGEGPLSELLLAEKCLGDGACNAIASRLLKWTSIHVLDLAVRTLRFTTRGFKYIFLSRKYGLEGLG